MADAASASVPADRVGIKFIKTPTGETHLFNFPVETSVGDLARYLFDNYPSNFPKRDDVTSPAMMKLMCKGRFLDVKDTLRSLKLPLGAQTGMQLVIRSAEPRPAGTVVDVEKPAQRQQTEPAGCCVIS
eukprot:c26902_g1_i1.p1 GENE.c26902_g1_i1~~c26902_g1_i1.p1  ORF type:complete len:129 (+),score=12.43 c26902_g1_i1:144-530(+)